MSRTSIEIRDVVERLIIVDSEKDRDTVTVLARQSLNKSIVSEIEVRVSKQALFRLIGDVCDALDWRVVLEEEVD